MPFLSPESLAELREKIRACRDPRVLLDGQLVPGSVPYLRALVSTAKDDYERDDLLVELGNEYFRADMDENYLMVQRERVQNHPDAALMWVSLAEALSRRPDGAKEANDATARAVGISRETDALLRYSLSWQARVARATGNREAFEQALAELLADAQNYRKEDSGFFGDFVENLPDGFCSPALMEAYKKVLSENDI